MHIYTVIYQFQEMNEFLKEKWVESSMRTNYRNINASQEIVSSDLGIHFSIWKLNRNLVYLLC